MEHSYFQDRLSAYHDNELPLQEKVVVEEHVRGCVECEKLLVEYARLDQLVAEHGQLADSDYWEKAAQKIDRAIASGGQTEIDHTLTHRRKGGLSWKLLAAAASVVIVGYIGINKDKFLSPDKQMPATQAPAALSRKDFDMAVQPQADSAEPQAQKKAEAKKDASRSTGNAAESRTDSPQHYQETGRVSSKEMTAQAPEKDARAADERDLKGGASEKIAVPKSAETDIAIPNNQPARAPAPEMLMTDSTDNLNYRRVSTQATSSDLETAVKDTGLGLAHWCAIRDSVLPLAESSQKSKNVVELGKTVISGYDKAERKSNRLAETAVPTPDARLAEASYWIAKLSTRPEEKAQALATLRKIGDRAVAPLKDSVQAWIKELTSP
jgi:hypothetical protein